MTLKYVDNQKMLQKIKGASMEHIFLKQQQKQQVQIIPLQKSSPSKQNIGQYSPNKQKIKDELDDISEQFNSLKHKKINFSKWDAFAPYSFIKLSHQQKDNVFQSLFQDFKKMKIEHNQYIQRYMRLFVKLHKLQNQISRFKKKGGLTTAEKIKIHKQTDQQNQKMKQQIKRLHQKILALTSNTKAPQKSKPSSANKTFSNTQKAIFPVNQNLKAELQIQKKHVKQLLQIIDEFKRNKMALQSEIKERNFNKNLQNNPSLRPGPRINGARGGMDNESKFKQYANDLMLWKQKYNDLQLCYNRMIQDKDKAIRQLHQQILQAKQSQRARKDIQRYANRPNFDNFGNDDRIRQLQDLNQKLQKQIQNLIKNAIFKDNTQSVDLTKKNSQLQAKLHKLHQENVNLKQQKIRHISQLQIKSKQSNLLKNENQKVKKQLKEHIEKDIKSSNKSNQVYKYDQNDYYRKLLHLVQLEGDDPVWKKYADLSSPVFTIMTETQLRQLAQKLWHNKLQLLAHLQKAQIQLKTYKQTHDSKIGVYLRQKQGLQEQLRLARARLDEWMSMDRVHGARKQFKIYQSKGLKYNDSISVFEDDEDQIKGLDHNQNFFDLFLGQLNLDESNILRHPQNKIKSMSNIISFLTIDFYNHATQHSNFAEGVSKKLLNNFSFKVQVNSYFIKFLNKNCISLQLWSPQGTSTVLFGKGQIWLNDLLNSSGKDVSNVIRGKCPIYSNSKILIATLQYRVRMRLPISPFLEWANTKDNINKHSKMADPFAINHRKKLGITVERAEGLQSRSNTFVYFKLQNQDFFTQPQMGSSPFWDYHRQIDVILDEQFCSYLKQNYIQFTLFDDQKQVNQDVIGIAKANLTSLLENNQPLELNLQIQDGNSLKVGSLKIKANWV